MNSKIPQVIKKLRLDCGFTQARVATLLGIDRSTYSYYESGKIKPDIKTILSLSRIYGVDYTEILDCDAEVLYASDVSGKRKTSHEDDEESEEYRKYQERSIILAFRLLSQESKEDVMRMIFGRVREEKNRNKKLQDWF